VLPPANPDSGQRVHPPLEIEIKLKPLSLQDAIERIGAAGFTVLHPRAFESNTLFDYADGRLKTGGEVLRLREFGGTCMITFKGDPQVLGGHKVREELETTVGSCAVLQAILGRLGYPPTFRYEKFRTTYSRKGDAGLLTLDETPIGPFLELEGDAHWIDRTATELGFPPEAYITDSYGRLWLRHCQETGSSVTEFVFAASSQGNG